MKKTLLAVLPILIIGNYCSAGSVTIVRSGASVDEFVDGDQHSLEDSIYDHGILLGDGISKATPLYHVLLPPPFAGGNEISSITVTIEGDNAWLSWPNAYIGTPPQGPYSLRESGKHTYIFTGSEAQALLASVGDGLGYFLDIEIDIGSWFDQYDLKEITVTYVYSGVSSDVLESYQQAYGAYRTLKDYKTYVVTDLWHVEERVAEDFYDACQEVLALADNLSGLSGSLYDALKSTMDSIENFQNLASILEMTEDYTVFWIDYTGPEKATVESNLTDAYESYETFAQQLLNRAFDGNINSTDAEILNGIIDEIETKVSDLRY